MGKRYRITIEFHDEIEEEMKVYRYLQSLKRKKTDKIVQMVSQTVDLDHFEEDIQKEYTEALLRIKTTQEELKQQRQDLARLKEIITKTIPIEEPYTQPKEDVTPKEPQKPQERPVPFSQYESVPQEPTKQPQMTTPIEPQVIHPAQNDDEMMKLMQSDALAQFGMNFL